jgi:hypothetical protein
LLAPRGPQSERERDFAKGVARMFDRLTYTWELMGASWDVLKRDKALLIFPALSGFCCLLVLASFAIPIWWAGAWQPPRAADDAWRKVAYYGILFLFYLVNSFVITFFNVTIIAGAIERLRGGDPTVGSCFAAALSRLPLILGWSLVSATVGLVLRVIEDRSNWVGRFVAGLLGAAWTFVTFLAVPIMVAERRGPLNAVQESAATLRRTWSEQLVSNFSFGLLFFVLAVPAYILIGLAVYFGAAGQTIVLAVACGLVAGLYILALALVQSALQSIFQAALYLHARGEVTNMAYPSKLLRDALS